MRNRVLLVANWDWVLYNFRLPLIRSLSENDLEVLIVCPDGEYVERLKAMGISWRSWNMDRRSISPIKELMSLIDLIRIYRRYAPKTVHHITIKPIFYGSIAARLTNVPVVINNFTGLGYLFSDARLAGWLRRLTLPFLRWSLDDERVSSVLLNKRDRQVLLSKGIITKEDSRVIPGDGVDLDLYHPPRHPLDDKDQIIILMAARLLWDKGVGEFIKAANSLETTGKEVQFWLAGKPDGGNPSSISTSKLDDWEKVEKVRLLGHREDMPSILREVDIAVLPSYHEGVPVFLLEAAASGLPLVASDIEGCRMIIEEGKNGFLISKGSVSELVEALEILIENSELRREMGRNSRAIVEKKFNKEKIIAQFIQLYKDLGVIAN